MKKTEVNYAISRRGFLSSGSKAVIVAGGITMASGLMAANAKIEKKSHFDASLLRMARDVYPHDDLADRYYEQPLALVKKSDAALLKKGIKDLDELAMKRAATKFIDISEEEVRVRILRSIEETPFFVKIKLSLLLGIYNNPKVWPFFGYEGSSWEKGGYLHRGFNDIDWL